jgi:kumamolisin
MKAGFVVCVPRQMLIGHRLNPERDQTYLYMSAKNIGNFINRFYDFLRQNSAVKLPSSGGLHLGEKANCEYSSNLSNGPLIAQGRSRKTWAQASQTAGIVMLFALSAGGQPIQPDASPGSNRVMFPESLKEVAAISSAAVVRSELAPAEAQTALDFSVALKMHNFAELQNRVARGEIISLDEIASKYYPTADEYKTVAAWLSSQGFAVKPADKYNLSIFASGTVAQIERVFATKFGRVNFQGVEYTSALSAPSLPAEVAAPVLGINGLQPHLHPRSHAIIVPGQPRKLINNAPPYTVSEIAKAYANSTSTDGSGQKIGILIDTFPNDSDLTAFWQFNGVNQSLNNIEKVQVVSGTLPNPSGEESLDVEWSSGIAPGAKVRIYAFRDLAFADIDQAYQAIINDLPSQPALHQISCSFGLSEAFLAQAQMATDAQFFATLAGAGVSVFVSSGDGGSTPGPRGYGDTSGPLAVQSPANDPNVTAVGGTSLNLDPSNGVVSSESAWSLGGGGISGFFSRPDWQTGPGVPAGSNRLVPDVALVADGNTGGVLFLNGEQLSVGGTSWSSPTWAGICAKINQARARAGLASVGLLGPKIYPLIGTSNFRDITTGTNGPNGFYNAGPGYDLCTGVGVPSIDALIQALGGVPGIHPVAKDFNGDGYADLAWENTGTGQVAIWLLKNGVFSGVISLPTVPLEWRIVGVGDFNGDGNADLVWEDTSTGQRGIWLLKNGVLSGAINLPTEPVEWHIAGAADFNGDGFADLVWENTRTGQHVIWLLKNGVLSGAINLPTEPVEWHIAGAADFNGDGFADLVWQNSTTGQRAIWFLNNGAFSSSISLPTEPVMWNIEDH